MRISGVFIHVSNGTIIAHNGATILSRFYGLWYWHSLLMVLTFSTSFVACWTCVYRACGPFYSWDWCLLWAPYLLLTYLDGLRNEWPFQWAYFAIPYYGRVRRFLQGVRVDPVWRGMLASSPLHVISVSWLSSRETYSDHVLKVRVLSRFRIDNY